MSRDTSEPLFYLDTEFRKLLERRDDVDLVTAALELARDSDQHLDFEPTRCWIEQRVEELAVESAGTDPDRCLEVVSEALGSRYDLRGDVASYQLPESSYLSHVIETRRGIPISLSLLYVAIGRRLGLEMYGVSAPAHFLVGCETPSGRRFVDAFAGGRILEEREIVSWLDAMTDLSRESIVRTLCPASPRAIVIRMLNNLKRLFVEREQWTASLRVQKRLTALQPAVFAQRRDLAVFSGKAGRFPEAIDLLERCLRDCPDKERSQISEQLREARSGVAGWN